ncbi:MAG: alpha-amylase family glycosyl hydrolase [Bacteroidota bacterium]|nr:alpha-amylase family glycosyl hydrolase [Bacteroidota bacterium]
MNIKKIQGKIFIILIAAFALSCNKRITFPAVYIQPITDTPFVQYGTPFTNVTPPQDAVIYQVNIRAFSQQGNLQGVTARLDSIKALGVNVIYLMPIYPVGIIKSVNSPYSVRDYLSVGSEFGTLTDLRALVDGAHSRNMSVILDWVANHTSWDNSWITAHKDWYAQDAAGNIISPSGYTDVAQLNFNNIAMRREMIKDMKYWVYTANVDGFRCDFADNPPVDFWMQDIDSLRNITTHKLLMLAEGSHSANYTAGFDYNFGFNFYGNLKSIYSAGKSVQSIDTLNQTDYIGATNDQQIVRYITNHDVNSSDGTPLQLFGGKNGSMAAFVVVACMKGVPMIYDGQEVGMATPITFPFSTVKIDWTLNPDLTAEYKKVIAFRNSSTAIRRGQLTSYTSTDVCAFTKIQTGDTALVISNLRNSTINYSLPAALANTAWQDAMNGGTVTLTTQLTLSPYSYFILKK